MTAPTARLAIRADGDGRLGFGHIMRCAALAHSLLDCGHKLVWFSRTPHAVPAKLAARIEIRAITPDDNETDLLLSGLAKTRATGLIGDWQTTDAKLCERLRRAGIWLALIGDHLGNAHADLVIRQGFGPATAESATGVCDGSAFLLLAPGYTGLAPRSFNPQVRRVLISLGGSDTPILDAVMPALNDLPGLADLELEIIRAAPPVAALPEAGLLPAMRAADIAILAAGTTLHEAAATGLAAIAVPITANQLVRAQQFETLKLGLTVNPGTDNFAPRLRQQLVRLLSSPALREQFCLAGQKSVDGRGAHRVARRITELLAPAQMLLNASISTVTSGPAS